MSTDKFYIRCFFAFESFVPLVCEAYQRSWKLKSRQNFKKIMSLLKVLQWTLNYSNQRLLQNCAIESQFTQDFSHLFVICSHENQLPICDDYFDRKLQSDKAWPWQKCWPHLWPWGCTFRRSGSPSETGTRWPRSAWCPRSSGHSRTISDCPESPQSLPTWPSCARRRSICSRNISQNNQNDNTWMIPFSDRNFPNWSFFGGSFL